MKLFLIFLFTSNIIFSQVNFTNFPKNKQLYKRSITTNTAEVNVSGTINSINGYASLVLKTYKNNVLINTLEESLIYNSGVANFNFTAIINAELSNYTFKLLSDTNVLLNEADEVVAGDLYIFQGQSNITFDNFSFVSPDPSKNMFIRSYNSEGIWTTDIQPLTFGGIGYWFAEDIVGHQNIPVAILNGGKGSKTISFFQRNDTYKYDSATNYGRLLARFNDAGFSQNDVTALIWYQGENDLGTSLMLYNYLFEQLYNDWEEDYSPDSYFVFQVHKGCGISSSTPIPEAHRQLQDIFDKVTTISTNGAAQNPNDVCHYGNTNGYNILAKRLYDIVAFRYYGTGTENGIYSPNISNLKFTNDSKTQVSFELLPATDTFTYNIGVIQDFFIENSNVTITSLNLTDNLVTLNLSSSLIVNEPKLSYLGREQDTIPYIFNQNGIGMLSFKSIAIADSEPDNVIAIDDGFWTYYYYETDLTAPIFGIEKTPTGTGANTLSITPQVSINTSTKVFNSKSLLNGTFCMARYWNITNPTLPNGWVNIRFFFDSEFKSDLENQANVFITDHSKQVISPTLYIQTEGLFDPETQIYPRGLKNISLYKSGSSINTGIYNGFDFLQLNQVQLSLMNGGSLLKTVLSNEAGKIRYDNSTQKFQGWNGEQWLNFN